MYFLFRDNTLISAYTNDVNLIKAQIPSLFVYAVHPFHIELVWRLPEFAFFVRSLRWSHFLFCEGRFNYAVEEGHAQNEFQY